MLIDAAYYRDGCIAKDLPVAPPERGAEWCPVFTMAATIPHGAAADPFPTDPAVHDAYAPVAFANHGTWHAKCPCGTPQIVCRSDRRMFCPNCLNIGADGAWVAVVWPADLEAIEALLEARMYPINRNYHPDEVPQGQSPLDHLSAENSAHDVGATDRHAGSGRGHS